VSTNSLCHTELRNSRDTRSWVGASSAKKLQAPRACINSLALKFVASPRGAEAFFNNLGWRCEVTASV
jgi:hypothetical protein